MPHYSDGTQAEIGDFVIGKGYNIKDTDTQELRNIIGTVLHINPDTSACNIQVGLYQVYDVTGPLSPPAGAMLLTGGKYAIPRIEYGQVDHFQKVR